MVISAVTQLSANRASLIIASNVTVAFVAVESTRVAGAFDDAGFILLAGERRELTFIGRRSFKIDQLKAGLRVRSLRDTY